MEIIISNTNNYSVNVCLFDLKNPNLKKFLTDYTTENYLGVTVSHDDEMKEFMRNLKLGDFDFRAIEWSCSRDGVDNFDGIRGNNRFTIIKSDPNHNFYGKSVEVSHYITATQVKIYPIVISFTGDADFFAIPLKNTVINRIDSKTNYLLEIEPRSIITLKFIQ